MIPQAFLTEWRSRVPWPFPEQVEQDLILSRLMIEIANDETLGPELVMRGGTCLHKLHLPEPLRYSEDLDYVRRTRSPIKPYVDALRGIAERVGLTVNSTQPTQAMFHVILITDATEGLGETRIRIKIETNVAETTFYGETTTIEHALDSSWWRGSAAVPTFSLDELIATKPRALYQRNKGRDLFDIWLVLDRDVVDPAVVVDGLHHYMGAGVFTYPQLRQNLLAKLADASFRADIETLVPAVPPGYEHARAADLVMERIGALLRNAPQRDAIHNGAWRA